MTHAYTLPRVVRARLEEALRGLRNADACLALATFLGRFQAGPANLGRVFPVDRRALARHPELELTEEQVRAATAALERVGFLAREDLVGSPFRPTAEGLRRKPVLRRIGLAFAALFRLVQVLAKRRRPTPQSHPRGIPAPMGGQPLQAPTALEAALARWGSAVAARAVGSTSSGIPAQ